MQGTWQTPSEHDDSLGPVILRCRLRPQKDVLTDAGLVAPSAQYVWVGSVIVLGALVLFVPLFVLLRHGFEMDDDDIRLAFFIAYPLNLLALAWVSYGWPRGDYLVLHEQGFRFRITYKRLTVCFDDLTRLRVGWDVPGWVKLTSTLGDLKHPGISDLTQRCSEHSVTVVLKSGKEHVLKGFLIRFHAEDTAQFLMYLLEKFPEVINPTE